MDEDIVMVQEKPAEPIVPKEKKKRSELYKEMYDSIRPGRIRPLRLRRLAEQATKEERLSILKKIVKAYEKKKLQEEEAESLILSVIMADEGLFTIQSKRLGKLILRLPAESIMAEMLRRHQAGKRISVHDWRDMKLDGIKPKKKAVRAPKQPVAPTPSVPSVVTTVAPTTTTATGTIPLLQTTSIRQDR